VAVKMMNWRSLWQTAIVGEQRRMQPARVLKVTAAEDPIGRTVRNRFTGQTEIVNTVSTLLSI
jgi:hypothetical protein